MNPSLLQAAPATSPLDNVFPIVLVLLIAFAFYFVRANVDGVRVVRLAEAADRAVQQAERDATAVRAEHPTPAAPHSEASPDPSAAGVGWMPRGLRGSPRGESAAAPMFAHPDWFIGEVQSLEQRSEGPFHVWTFRVDRLDSRRESVDVLPVEIRSTEIRGAVREGDRVAVPRASIAEGLGAAPGVVVNLTSRSAVIVKRSWLFGRKNVRGLGSGAGPGAVLKTVGIILAVSLLLGVFVGLGRAARPADREALLVAVAISAAIAVVLYWLGRRRARRSRVQRVTHAAR